MLNLVSISMNFWQRKKLPCQKLINIDLVWRDSKISGTLGVPKASQCTELTNLRAVGPPGTDTTHTYRTLENCKLPLRVCLAITRLRVKPIRSDF